MSNQQILNKNQQTNEAKAFESWKNLKVNDLEVDGNLNVKGNHNSRGLMTEQDPEININLVAATPLPITNQQGLFLENMQFVEAPGPGTPSEPEGSTLIINQAGDYALDVSFSATVPNISIVTMDINLTSSAVTTTIDVLALNATAPGQVVGDSLSTIVALNANDRIHLVAESNANNNISDYNLDVRLIKL